MVDGPFKTGNEPTSIAIDPRGILSTSPTRWIPRFRPTPSPCPPAPFHNVRIPGSAPRNITDTHPVSIIVDPALGRFVYTANYLGNSVSGFRLDPNDGRLEQTQATPYPTGANPTALIAVPHGNHRLTQSVTAVAGRANRHKEPSRTAGLFADPRRQTMRMRSRRR